MIDLIFRTVLFGLILVAIAIAWRDCWRDFKKAFFVDETRRYHEILEEEDVSE